MTKISSIIKNIYLNCFITQSIHIHYKNKFYYTKDKHEDFHRKLEAKVA